MFGASRALSYSLWDSEIAVWTPSDRVIVSSAFQAWADVANISFAEIQPGGTFFNNSSDISISAFGDANSRTAGIGIFPDPQLADSFLFSIELTRLDYPTIEGDILLNAYHFVFDDSYPGGIGFSVALHEIGHTLGLKHPHDDGANFGPTFGELGVPGLDDNLYTVMSYNNAANQSFPAGYPSTPMVLDIEAIQYIYGPNLSFHTGNDVYTLSDNKQLRTIWDAGGNDALDARSFDMGATIDLREGGFSNHGSADSWTAIAYGVTIERAFGSSFDDDIFGNESANRIDGASGADRIFGGGGNDVLIGNRGSDFVDGGTGADQLIGGFANDVLIGRQGADRYVFAAGDGADRISEGGGSDPTVLDTVVVQDIASVADIGFARSADGSSLMLDLGGGDSVVLDRQFSQAVQRVEQLELSDGTALVLADGMKGGPADGIVVGTAGSDFLDAGAGDDVLVGGVGNDLLIGRQGADSYIFGAGDGIDRISEGGDSAPTILDTVVLQDILDIADIGFSRDGSSLFLDLSGGDRVVLDRHFSQAVQRVEQLELSDGTVLTLQGGPVGGTGDDVIIGTSANDILTGDDGDDLFVLADGGGADRITDFTAGLNTDDAIDVRDFGFASFADVTAAASQVGGGTLIQLDSNDSLSLLGINLASLHGSDFLL